MAVAGGLVLLDMDGVLVDSRPIVVGTVLRVASNCGIHLREEWVKRRALWSPARIFREAGITSNTALREFDAEYRETLRSQDPVFPGIRGALEYLAALGLTIGVVTSQPRRRYEAAARTLLHLISVAVTADDIHGRYKPDPYGISLAIKRCGLNTPAACYVGDLPTDIRAAKSAGILSVAALWGYGKVDEVIGSQPDHVLERPEELMGLGQWLG